MFLLKKFTVFSTKKLSQFAKEVQVTFSTRTFFTRFVNSTSLAVNEKSYLFYRPTGQLLSLVFLMRLLNLLMRPFLNDEKISMDVK